MRAVASTISDPRSASSRRRLRSFMVIVGLLVMMYSTAASKLLELGESVAKRHQRSEGVHRRDLRRGACVGATAGTASALQSAQRSVSSRSRRQLPRRRARWCASGTGVNQGADDLPKAGGVEWVQANIARRMLMSRSWPD